MTTLDRVALPLFITALIVAWLLAPRPRWELSVDGEKLGTLSINAQVIPFPVMPRDGRYHHFVVESRGTRAFARYEISAMAPAHTASLDYARAVQAFPLAARFSQQHGPGWDPKEHHAGSYTGIRFRGGAWVWDGERFFVEGWLL